jgi:SlyX protein
MLKTINSCLKCNHSPPSHRHHLDDLTHVAHAVQKIVSNTLMNSPTQHDTQLDDRLINLEIKASYTDDLVEQLNQVIIRQQSQIDALIREVVQLKEQAPEAGSGPGRNLRDDLPPHF